MFKRILRNWLTRSIRWPLQNCPPSVFHIQRYRPGLEFLEDRVTPTQFYVTALTDSGTGSGNSGDLLYCLNQANTDGTTSTNSILFNVSGTVVLSSTLPAIANNLTISAPTNLAVTIDGNSLGSVLVVNSSETVTLSGLTITGGNAPSGTGGGGILNGGTLTVNGCTVFGNASAAKGAGIFNNYVLTINSSTITSNAAATGGGGVFNNGGITTINNSTVTTNSGTNGAGLNSSGTVIVSNSIFSNNVSTGGAGGGGAFYINSGTLSVTNSTLSNNTAADLGGGICNIGATITVSGSTISSNTASNGGGIYSQSSFAVSTSTLSGNYSSGVGGGIDINGGSATISTSTISGNTGAGGGGGICNFSSTSTLIVNDSTLTGNTGSGSGAGGGGIINVGPAAILNSTISNNTATGSGAVGGGIAQYGSSITLHDTIDAGNTLGSGAADPDFYGTINTSVTLGSTIYSEGYNLIGNSAGSVGFVNGLNGDQVGTAASPILAQLGTLQNNGGSTLTMAPIGSSPAVNAGDPSNTSSLPQTDQRGPGFARIVGGRADIGAFESSFLPTPFDLSFGSVPSTVTAGQTFSFQVDVLDSHGNLVTTDSSTLAATLTGPGSFTSGSSNAQVSGGIATFTGLSIQTAGSYTLQIFDTGDGLAPTTTNLTINPASPSILSVSSGSGQSATVSAAYASPLQVKLTDAYGNPISGSTVTFTVPGSGASVALTGNPATTSTSGLASVTATANTTAHGSFTVTATDGSLSTAFQLTNTPGIPNKLVYLDTPPSTNTAVAGQAISNFQVAIEDSNGNVITTDDSAVSILLGTGSLLTGTTTVNAVNGIATLSGLTTDVAGGNAFLASDSADSLADYATPITIDAGSPALLDVSSGSGQSSTVGSQYASNLIVKLTDAFGNPINGATVAFATPGSGATVTFTGGPDTTTASTGLAAVTPTANSTAGTFTVTATSDNLTTSFELTNTPGAASKLVFLETPPSTNTATAGQGLSTFQVAIEDSQGNVVTSDSHAVSISLSTGSLLTGATTVNAINGIATFTGLTTAVAGAPNLQVNDSAESLTQISAPITIVAGSPALLSVSGGSGQSATVGAAYATALKVELADAYGNPISGASVTFTAPTSGATGTFGGSSTVTTSALGIATAPTFTAGSTAGSFTVTATSGSFSTLFPLTNTPGAASKLVFVETPPSTNTATAGQALSTFQVAIEDSDGNVVTSDSHAVSISLSSGSLLTGATTANAINGIATFTGLTTDVAVSTTLQASDTADILIPISTPITIDAGSPTLLSVSSGLGQSATVGAAYATALKVELTDAYGNPINGASVTFTAPTSGATGTFGGSSTVTTSALGIATAPTFIAGSTAGSFTVVAASGSFSTLFPLTNTPGAASKLVFLETPPSTNTATAGQALSTFQVAIEDSDGNVVTSDSHAVSISLSSGSLLTGTTTANAINGIATFTGLTTDVAGAPNLQVNDSAESLTQISTLITIDAGSPALLSVWSGSGQSATVGAAYATALKLELTDAYGNPISGASVTFTAPTSGATGTFGGSSTVTTSALGIATAPTFTAGSTAGSFTVVASSGSFSTSFPLTNTPGAASKLVFLETPPSTNTATAGQALSTFQVAIEDSQGNVVTSDSHAVSITLSSGSLTGTTTVDAVNGVATFTGLTTDVAVSTTLQASDTADILIPISTPITIDAGSPSLLSVSGGLGQSATVGAAYATALKVELTDAYGNPISGASVTFTAPTSGATGTFSGSSTVTTSASGIATAPTFTAGSTAGSFAVVATSGSFSTSFPLTNTPGAASKLVFLETPPSTNTATAGQALSTFQVAIEDSNGNVVTSDNNPIAISLSSGSLTGTTTLDAVNGIATFTGLTANLAGSNTLQASDSADTLTPISSPIFINAGSPALLSAINGSDQVIAAGVQFLSPLEVMLTDAYGNPISGARVTYTNLPDGQADATFVSNTVSTNSSGLASNTASAGFHTGSYTVVASTGNLSTTFQLTNGPDSANNLVFLGTSLGTNIATAGQALPSFQVAIEDIHNNIDTFDDNAVSISLNTGSLTGATTVNAVNGIATFTGIAADLAGANTLQASDSADSGISPISTPITIDAGSPALLSVVSGSGQSAIVGTAYSTAFQVELTDAYGNPISGASVTFTAPVSSASGTFGGNSTVTTTASGIATAPTFTAGSTAGSFAVTATSGSFSTSFQLTNNPGVANTLVFFETPPGTNTATVGQAISNFQVAIEDSQGNVETSDDNPVSISLSSGSLTGTTSVDAVDGIASFNGLTTQSPGANNLVATDSTDLLTPISTPISINALNQTVPTFLTVVSGSGQSASVGSAFSTALQVKLTDAAGNPISGASVTFTTPTSGATGIFGGSATVATNAQGIATAPALTAGHTAGSFNVSASSASLSTTFSLTNTAGAAANISAASSTSETTVIGTAFSPLQVLVTDSYGNLVRGLSVTFAAPPTGSTGVFSSPATVLTNALGIATAPAFTANHLPGTFAVTASASGVSGSVSFNLGITDAPASIAVSSGSGQSAQVTGDFATPLQALVTDASKKPIAGIAVVFEVPSTGAGAFAAGSVMVVTNSQGIATSPILIANTTAGTFSVLASVAGLATPVAFSLTNTGAAAVSVTAVNGAYQSVATKKAFAAPLEAQVKDQYGNPVAGVTVTFAAPSTGASGLFKKTSTVSAVTAANGIATAPAFTAGKTAGNFTVMASIGVGSPAAFNLTNLSTAATKSLAKTGTGQSASVTQQYGTGLQVQVTTAKGVGVSGVWVTFTAPASGASGLFNGSSSVSVQTNAQGLALAPTLTANGVAGKFTVTATASGIAGTTLFSLTNMPGSAAAVSVATGSGQSTGLGNRFAIPLVVAVTDSFGNAVSGVSVTLTVVPAAGADGTFSGSLSTVTVVTNAQGLAIAPTLTADATSGTFTVTAAISGEPDAVFTLTNV